jgi:hypothetical protein
MLTVDKLKTYQRFGGDMDGWALHEKFEGNPTGMTTQDWFLIEELRQGLRIVAAGLASASYRTSIEAKVMNATSDADTRELLRKLVSEV